MRCTRTHFKHLGLFLWMLAAIPITIVGCGRGSVFLKNNGYRQVLIAVGEDVTEDHTLIERIKQVFTDTSALLYNVTRRRAYLQEINILIPKTWTKLSKYEPAGNEAIDNCDIRIDKPDSRYDQGNRPFVIKSTPCGELGHYMHITPDYFLDPKVAKPYGPYEKVMVHEWGHLRYGVFDEYPTDKDPHFYHGPGSSVEATRCSAKLEGEMYDEELKTYGCLWEGSLPDGNCRFRDFQDELEPKYASLMYRQYLAHIVSFCDNDTSRPHELHNREAPSQQNKKCGYRSVWEVLRSHEDFDGVNPARNVSNTTPQFRLLQAQENRYVLILDVSGSMGKPKTRIENLGRGCSNFISNIVRDGERVGIVWFSKNANRAHEIVTVNNQTRQSLLDKIPVRTTGGTSIASGVLEALEMLKDAGGTNGASLIVVSDGEENRPPRLPSIVDKVLEAKVTVHAIAFTNQASNDVDALAKATGGLAFLYTDREQSNALNEAFRTIGDLNQNIRGKKLPINSEARNLASQTNFSHTVSIDSTLGRNTEFIFDYGGSDIDVILTSPTGLMYDKNSYIVTHDNKFGIYKFAFIDVGEAGRWNYTVKNLDYRTQKVSVTVVSQTATPGKYPIIAQSYWGSRQLDHTNTVRSQSLYASVSQGYHSVLSADVRAHVETPGGVIEKLPLYDTGHGADQIQDDGIYSAYFVRFNGNGRYNVKVIVNSMEATRISSIRVVGRGAAVMAPDVRSFDTEFKVTDLERTASGGSFELKNYKPGKVYLPGRITDMEVISVNLDMLEVALTWTAPGAEMDQGKVSEYEVRFGTSFDEVLTNFSSQVLVTPPMVRAGNLSDPGSPGERESFTIIVPAIGDVTYVFGVVSKDTDGRKVQGELSNLVSAGMKDYQANNSAAIIAGAIFRSITVLAIVMVLVIAINRIKATSETV